jgi:hypothetical protein
LSFTVQNRMSGMSARIAPTACSSTAWLRARWSLGTKFTTIEALRTSWPEPSTRPPSTKTLATSGSARSRARMRSDIASVSARRAPGGSSIAKIERALSSGGRKPEGSSRVLAIDAAKSAMPTATAA